MSCDFANKRKTFHICLQNGGEIDDKARALTWLFRRLTAKGNSTVIFRVKLLRNKNWSFLIRFLQFASYFPYKLTQCFLILLKSNVFLLSKLSKIEFFSNVNGFWVQNLFGSPNFKKSVVLEPGLHSTHQSSQEETAQLNLIIINLILFRSPRCCLQKQDGVASCKITLYLCRFCTFLCV